MHHQNARQDHDLMIVNKSFENVAKFKHLRMTVTNRNYIQEEVNSSSNSGNACYHSVQNILSSRLLSENVKVKVVPVLLLTEHHAMKAHWGVEV